MEDGETTSHPGRVSLCPTRIMQMKFTGNIAFSVDGDWSTTSQLPVIVYACVLCIF